MVCLTLTWMTGLKIPNTQANLLEAHTRFVVVMCQNLVVVVAAVVVVLPLLVFNFSVVYVRLLFLLSDVCLHFACVAFYL
jgi:hypothetical protein